MAPAGFSFGRTFKAKSAFWQKINDKSTLPEIFLNFLKKASRKMIFSFIFLSIFPIFTLATYLQKHHFSTAIFPVSGGGGFSILPPRYATDFQSLYYNWFSKLFPSINIKSNQLQLMDIHICN